MLFNSIDLPGIYGSLEQVAGVPKQSLRTNPERWLAKVRLPRYLAPVDTWELLLQYASFPDCSGALLNGLCTSARLEPLKSSLRLNGMHRAPSGPWSPRGLSLFGLKVLRNAPLNVVPRGDGLMTLGFNERSGIGLHEEGDAIAGTGWRALLHRRHTDAVQV